MTRANTLVWITLLLLSCANFVLGDQKTFAWLILAVAGVKSALVAWHFMELRKAAFIWSAALAVLLGIILGMAVLLT